RPTSSIPASASPSSRRDDDGKTPSPPPFRSLPPGLDCTRPAGAREWAQSSRGGRAAPRVPSVLRQERPRRRELGPPGVRLAAKLDDLGVERLRLGQIARQLGRARRSVEAVEAVRL